MLLSKQTCPVSDEDNVLELLCCSVQQQQLQQKQAAAIAECLLYVTAL